MVDYGGAEEFYGESLHFNLASNLFLGEFEYWNQDQFWDTVIIM